MTDRPLEPDPSFITGGVAKTPFVLRTAPADLFRTRAERFRFLAQSSDLAGYLDFLAALTEVQRTLLDTLPAPEPVSDERKQLARQAGLPPIDRAPLADEPGLHATLRALCDAALDLSMPDAAREALEAVREADDEDRRWLLANVLSDVIPESSMAPHVFAAAAVQVYMARLAADLPDEALQPISTGVCPACGGRPVTSSVIGLRDIENVRYAHCACCATQWNEVRIKCLCCGSTQGISYRSAGTDEATVKAEVCRECGYWVKTLYQIRNTSLEPVADDVGSMGLDLLMQRDTPFRRGGFNPYLMLRDPDETDAAAS